MKKITDPLSYHIDSKKCLCWMLSVGQDLANVTNAKRLVFTCDHSNGRVTGEWQMQVNV